MKLGEQLPIQVLKVCPCVGTSLCSLCVSFGFGGRDESEVNTGCFFHWSVLAARALVGGRPGVRGARA